MFFKTKQRKLNEELFFKNKQRLESYIAYAQDLIVDDPYESLNQKEKMNGLNKIHKILISSIQQKIFENVISSPHPIDSYRSDRYFFDSWTVPNCPFCQTKYEGRTITTLKNPIKVFLNTDPVLSFPWNKDRLSTLQYIGYRTNKPFINHSTNHKMTYFYPINVFLVYNGMHSIFAGIYDRAHYSYSNQMIDISLFYKYYFFDGTNFRHYDCNKIINTPDYLEIGILYELGRIYLDMKIDFSSYYNLNCK